MLWGSLGSSWVAGVCPECRWVHPGSLGSLGCVLWVIGLLWGRCVLWGERSWSSPCGSSGSSWVPGFIGMHPVGCLVHLGSIGSSLKALGVVEFIRGRWINRGVHRGSTTGSLGSSGCAPGIVCLTGFIEVHTGGRRIYPVPLG